MIDKQRSATSCGPPTAEFLPGNPYRWHFNRCLPPKKRLSTQSAEENEESFCLSSILKSCWEKKKKIFMSLAIGEFALSIRDWRTSLRSAKMRARCSKWNFPFALGAKCARGARIPKVKVEAEVQWNGWGSDASKWHLAVSHH